jgi:hypothetical protein
MKKKVNKIYRTKTTVQTVTAYLPVQRNKLCANTNAKGGGGKGETKKKEDRIGIHRVLGYRYETQDTCT